MVGRVLIYLIRHGEAVAARDLPDAFRMLTGEGRAAMAAQGKALAKTRPRVERMLTSPLCRAVQTAEIVASRAGFKGEIESEPALLPDATASAVARAIEKTRAQGLALVGHEPLLGHVVTVLTGRPSDGLRKGEIVCLELGRGGLSGGWRLAPGAKKPVPL